LTFDRDTVCFKHQLAGHNAERVHDLKWYHTLREDMPRFMTESLQIVLGRVKLRLSTENVLVAGRYSPMSFWREEIAPFGYDGVYDQQDAEGFINLFGLQVNVKVMMEVSGGAQTRYAAPDDSIFKRY
jgi:argininosuccinate synthase